MNVTIRRRESPELVKPNPPNMRASYEGLRDFNLERAMANVGTRLAAYYLDRAAAFASLADDREGALALASAAETARGVA